MAITQGICHSFQTELLQAVHDFSTDVFKIALYTTSATITPATTTVYTITDEVTDSAYTAGGKTLTATIASSNGISYVDFADVNWTGSVTAGGALIYNSSKGNKAVAVLNFGGNITRTDFAISFPEASYTSAIIRLGT